MPERKERLAVLRDSLRDPQGRWLRGAVWVLVLAALGAWLGWTMLPTIILLSSVVGALVGIILIVFAKRGRDKPIPFGPYLAAAGVIGLLYGAPLSQLTLGLVG